MQYINECEGCIIGSKHRERPSAFIVSRCLEPVMKHEARGFDMASQTLNFASLGNCDVNILVNSGK